MTRKRFIKLVMSKGKQRNEANKIANLYNARKIPYSRAYISFQVANNFAEISKAAKKIPTVCKELAKSFGHLRIVLGKGGDTE